MARQEQKSESQRPGEEPSDLAASRGSTLKLKGKVTLKHYRNGKLIRRLVSDNIVVSAGKNQVTQTLEVSPGPTRPGWMAIGDSSASPLETQTALVGTEHFRVAFTSTVRVGNVITYEADFTNTNPGDITVAEAGIFNAAAAGTMLARWLTQSFDMANNDQVNIQWVLTIG